MNTITVSKRKIGVGIAGSVAMVLTRLENHFKSFYVIIIFVFLIFQTVTDSV